VTAEEVLIASGIILTVTLEFNLPLNYVYIFAWGKNQLNNLSGFATGNLILQLCRMWIKLVSQVWD